ncbi:MAG: hypothetical protein R1F52_01830 [Candidatus Nitrosoabyssus spongiisocia]|nr:MAG: hypothetical protein R1F52_01830 [Nitrosopumilaceae archaeon AB1(1)]
MSETYYRRGRNWYTAIGSLFIIMALITLVRELFIWGYDFVIDFLFSSEITNEKISIGMIIFGAILIGIGFTKNGQRQIS